MNVCCITPKQKKSLNRINFPSRTPKIAIFPLAYTSTLLFFFFAFFFIALFIFFLPVCFFFLFPRAFRLPQTENTTIYIPILLPTAVQRPRYALYTVTKRLRRQKKQGGGNKFNWIGPLQPACKPCNHSLLV